MYHFCVCDNFFSPSGYPINSLFQCKYVFIRCFRWNIFLLNYQNAYGHQTFQCGDMWQGALTHKYPWHFNGVALLGHVTNKIHISICRKCIDITVGKVLTLCQLEAPTHGPLIKWPTWGHVTAWKIYISIFMRFIANKLGKLLTLGRIFITQIIKSSPTSC